MKIHHLRSATFIIESGADSILIDPMLSNQGQLPPFAYFRHKSVRNPTVALPGNASRLLGKVTHCLITHSQTFGIRALQHTDHLDKPGETFLRNNNIPVTCRKQDAAYLENYGINVVKALSYWQPERFLDGEITAIPARHGYGWIHRFMANGAGFYLQLPEEPSIYISGDTVYTRDVERVLSQFRPDIAVMAAGSASMDIGKPILMTMEDMVAFVKTAPNKVVANHLEALNHCPVTRSHLRQTLDDHGLLPKTFIPDDGDSITIETES